MEYTKQVSNIFVEWIIDYDPQSEITKNYYAMVQNKFHFAIAAKTTAEIIYTKADAEKENMGLTTWKSVPSGLILKPGTSYAKNHLQEKEIKRLERTCTGYFDDIENWIERENTFTMENLAKSFNRFLNFNEFKVLKGKGEKSHKTMWMYP